jgi:hypothetical protein
VVPRLSDVLTTVATSLGRNAVAKLWAASRGVGYGAGPVSVAAAAVAGEHGGRGVLIDASRSSGTPPAGCARTR